MKPLAIVSVLILGGLAWPVQAEPLQAIETFKYAFRLSGAVAQARQDEAFTGIDSAKGKEVVGAAMDQFDIDELARRVSGRIADALSEQEATACVDFIRSRVGADFLEAMEPARDQAESERRLRTLPNTHRAPIEGFLRMSCYQKAAQLLVSPAVMRAQSGTGVCAVSGAGTGSACAGRAEGVLPKMNPASGGDTLARLARTLVGRSVPFQVICGPRWIPPV